MRKVTETIVQAFYHDRTARHVANSSTDGQTLFLHGNAIARHFKDAAGHEGVEISLAGWNTPTTRDRINGLLVTMGYNGTGNRPVVRVYNRKREPFLGQWGNGFPERKEEMPTDGGWVRVYAPRDAVLRGVNMTGPTEQRFAWFGGVKRASTPADARPDFAFVLHGSVQEG